MEEKNNNLNTSNNILNAIKEFENKYSKYICGFAHNINSPLSGIVSRLDYLKFTLDVIEKHIKSDNKEKAFEKIQKLKEDFEKMENASEKIRTLMGEVQNFSSLMQEPEKTIFSIKGKIKELITYLDCDLFIKHKIEFNIIDNLKKKTLNNYVYNYLKPIQYIIEEITSRLPETITPHKLTLNLSDDEDFLIVDFVINLPENSLLQDSDTHVDYFKLTEILTIKQNGSLKIDLEKNPIEINLKLKK